jgi:hypothetical protein
MASYLLNCGCGKTVPVEIGQAGGRVSCSCGTQLDVPTLRQLRHLPQAKVEQTQSRGSWGTRQGWIAASSIVVAALLAWSAWSWWTEPAQPKFVAADYIALVDAHLKEWTPADAWKRWIEFYRPLAERGLPVFQAGNAAEIESRITHARFLRRMLWSVAGIFAAAAAAGVFWPEPVAVKTRRQGDKATRRNG